MPKSDSPSEVHLPRSPRSATRFQFSLAKLLIAIAVVAVLLFLVTKVGSVVEVMLFSFVACIVPTPLIISAIYARGDIQAFAIGALVPWGVTIVQSPEQYGIFFGVIWLLVMGGICGVLAVLTKRWVWPNRD